MARIEIYTKSWCPYCHQAKALLDGKGIEYVEYDVTDDEAQELEMQNRTDRTSVPQIYIEGDHLGRFDDLMAAASNGRLSAYLNQTEHETEAATG